MSLSSIKMPLSLRLFMSQYLGQYLSQYLRACLLAFLGIAVFASAHASESSEGVIYKTVYALAMESQHRLPGSVAHKRCLDGIEKICEQHGLKTYRQPYHSLVPVTEECSLTFNNKQVQNVFPLAPNGGIMLTSTGGKPVTGPAYYIGSGLPEDIKSKDLRGAIVIMDLGSQRMLDVFAEGALAVIFVGNKDATRFTTSAHFTKGRQNIPRIYISGEDAALHGLMQANGETLSLNVATQWKDVLTENLLIHLPATEKKVFNLEGPEQIILSACIDTFGLVPDRNKDQRRAANAALLIQSIVDQAKSERKRDVLAVLWGSHYAGQEAARHLYLVHRIATTTTTINESLDAHYLEVNEDLRDQLALIKNPDLINLTDDPAFHALRKRFRECISSQNNDLNFQIQRINIANQKSYDENNEIRVAALIKKRNQYNELYGHITELATENLEQLRKTYMNEFEIIRAQLQIDIERFSRQTLELTENHAVRKSLLPLFKDKNTVLHLEFDYSNAQQDVFANAYGVHTLYQRSPQDALNAGIFIRQLENMAGILEPANKLLPDGAFQTDMYLQHANPSLLSQRYPTPLNTEVAISSGVFAYHLQHIADDRASDDMPDSHEVSLQHLIPFNKELISLLSNDERLSVKSSFPTVKHQDRFILHSCRIRQYAKGTNEIEGPAIGAVCSVSDYNSMKPLVGHITESLSRVNGDGSLFEPMLTTTTSGSKTAAIFNQAGGLSHIGFLRGGYDVNVFAAFGGGFFTPFVTDNYDLVLNIYHYNGNGNNKFVTSYEDHDRDERVFYTDRESNFKISDTAGLLILNETGHPKDHYYGTGLPLNDSLRGLNSIEQSSRDYQTINTRRLDTLRSNNISVNSVENVHTLAHHHLRAAEEAREQKQPLVARAHELYGLSLSKRAYGPLRQVPKDLTSAIVILLIISIPFAFALERLMCGFPTIQKQILGFMGFFLATFIVLYMVHPAFSISATPSVIFLAFVIVIMSGLVINIIMGKFKYELMALQGLTSKSHSQEKNSSVGMASVLIGISSMRNRPLKTFLTSLTIILLTFTVLVFGSFNAQEEVVKTHLGNSAGQQQIEIFRNSLLHMPDRLREAIKQEQHDSFAIYERSALFHNPTLKLGPFNTYIPVLTQKKNAADTIASSLQGRAMLGLQPEELAHDSLLMGALPDGIQKGKIYLSATTAESLDLHVGDAVRIFSKQFVYGGAFAVNQLRSLRYIDNKKVLPPDYLATIDELSGGRPSVTLLNDQMNNLDAGSFRWANTDTLIVAHYQDVMDLEGVSNVLTLYPKKDVEIDKHAESLAQIFPDPIYVRSSDGDQQYFYTTAFSGSGFGDIWVPLLLGGLIIFSSLLGSIVDREREIFTFSALGLAPPNVAALFFAESSVYAVIGGMGGYLISQVVAALLAWLSAQGIYEAPEMNFSSLSSIYTILLVMLIVLLSTIYPAIKAGKSANPGINRKWKMPEPVDGKLSFLFPFTISEHNLLGIVSFIAEHFENHADASLGLFAASQISIEAISDTDYQLRAHTALSPFDLGIAQFFTLRSRDSDIDGIKEIHIELLHNGGSPAAWLRNNRRFLDDLRHQFLLWRSLPVETVEYYCSKTRNATAANK